MVFVLRFFFDVTATAQIYTLSLHDALPISYDKVINSGVDVVLLATPPGFRPQHLTAAVNANKRSEEHTSELQSRQYLVCRLLLEKKKQQFYRPSRFMTRQHDYYAASQQGGL